MQLAGQTVVVTGGGSGIGRAIVLRFVREGARVAIGEINPTAAAETVRQAEAAGGEILSVITDVSQPEQITRLFEAVDQQGWELDCLVNNAGNVNELRPIEETTDAQWNSEMDVHLGGTFRCCREAVRRMKPRGRGNIINLGSVAGLRGLPGASAYTAAKGAVISLTKGLSHEVAPAGIRVNCIAPGWVDTPILNSLPEKWRGRMERDIPLGRLGTPDELASVALFLASEQSSFITGQVISPNGGMYR